MLILIDSNYLAYYHAFKNEDFSHDGKSTGVIFGFLKSILFLAKTFDTNRFAFAWDSRRSFRRNLYPEYKANRHQYKDEKDMMRELEIFRQFVELRLNVLPEIGFKNIFLSTGLEADDIIASICKDNPEEEMVIVSSDNDLWQLLTPEHYMYNIKSKKIYGKSDFIKEWDIRPEDWAMVKSIAGCSGDNVPGVDGVGNKTAIKFLKGELSLKTKTSKNIRDAFIKGAVAETRVLVALPFPGTYLDNGLHLQKDEEFMLPDFLDMCDEYGFRSFKAQELVWRDLFDMKVRRKGQ